MVELTEVLGELTVGYDGAPLAVRYEEVDRLGQAALYLASDEGERAYAVSIEGGAAQAQVTVAGHVYQVTLEDERIWDFAFLHITGHGYAFNVDIFAR